MLSLIIYFIILILKENFLSEFFSFILLFFRFIFFFSWNFIYFYIFFELRILPVILITIFFGYQVEKINSLYYLVLYSFLTGLPILFIILIFNIKFCRNLIYLNFKTNLIINLIFFITFLIKFPIYFIHNWLPKIHVESSIIGRILLAGLLLKFGTIGFSFLIEIINFSYFYLFFLIRILRIFLRLISRLIQVDIKSFIAFSSIIHIRLIFIIFLINRNFSIRFNFIIIIRHGLISPLLFCFISIIFHNINNRIINIQINLLIRNIWIFIRDLISIIINCSSPLGLSFYTELSFFWLINIYINFIELIIFLNFIIDFYGIIFLIIILLLRKKIQNFILFLKLIFFYIFLINLNFFVYLI